MFCLPQYLDRNARLREKIAILFDLDGTLVDAFEDIAAAVNAPLVARGRAAHPLAAVRKMVGSGIVELCRRAAPDLSGAEFDRYLADVRAEYQRAPVSLAYVYPGIADMLARLCKLEIPLGVLSNKPHGATVDVVAQLGLAKYFDIVQGEDPPAIPRKPDPTGARHVLAELRATHAIVVGDMPQDGALAQAIGAPFVGVLWSEASAAELEPSHPIALCATADQVFDVISRELESLGHTNNGTHSK